MTAVPFLDLGRANREIRGELDRAVASVLDSGWFVLGPQVEAFEAEFASYVGARHCIGVANGLDAMTLTLRAWGIGPGKEVIVPSNTYIATWLAVSHCGATVVPAEPPDGDGFNVTATSLADHLTPRTAAILPVHLYGAPADLAPIVAVAAGAGVRVLADAAQAHGASWNGRKVGSFGDATAWSFYPTKNLGALGDGGAVTTDDDATAMALRELRNYGETSKYVNHRQGSNSRLDELQAAILRVKLRHLDTWVERRQRIAENYRLGLAGTGLILPVPPEHSQHAWHVYVVRHPRRDDLARELASRGIGTLIHYPVPPHLQPAYAEMGLGPGSFPVSEAIHREVLSLPLSPYLTDAEVDAVVGSVTESCQALRSTASG